MVRRWSSNVRTLALDAPESQTQEIRSESWIPDYTDK